MQPKMGTGWSCILALAVCIAGCDDDDDGSSVGSSCESAEQCFVTLGEEVEGEPVCLDRVENGYCTHQCADDDNCCAVEGECPNGKEQVCAPFESTGQRLCFLSCEGQEDADGYCDQYAYRGFICRSTGGGSQNRKVCVPGG